MLRARWVVGVALLIGLLGTGLTVLSLWDGGSEARRPALGSAMHVGGVVFVDRNVNDRLDEGERALAGLAVEIRATESGTERSTVTDSDGAFVVEVGAVPSVDVAVELSLRGPSGGPKDVPIQLRRRVAAGTVVEIPVRPGERTECTAPGDCTGLLLPDLVSLGATPPFLNAEVRREYPGPTQWTIDVTTKPGRRLLRVATISANVGAGPLLVIGTGQRDGTFGDTVQRVLDPTGGWLDVGAGRFGLSEAHRHVHLEALEEIRLVSGAGTVAAARKVSFCLTDVFPTTNDARPNYTVGLSLALFDCGVGQQGINAGMADYYGPALPEQFLDVTELPAGAYRLEIETDPDDVLVESDETNNVVGFDLYLPRD